MAKINGKTVLFSPVILPIADGSIENKKLASYVALPPGCKRLLYLESSQTQYINTGVAPVFEVVNGKIVKATGLKIVAFQPTTGSGVRNLWLGSADNYATGSIETNGINIFANAGQRKIEGVYSSVAGTFVTLPENALFNGELEIKPLSQTSLGYYHNGVEVSVSGTVAKPFVSISQITPMILFGLALSSEYDVSTDTFASIARLNAGLRIFACEISEYEWNDDSESFVKTIKRNFVPALNAWDYGTVKPGFFDTVSQRFFYNAGSDEFIYG